MVKTESYCILVGECDLIAITISKIKIFTAALSASANMGSQAALGTDLGQLVSLFQPIMGA